MTDGSSFDLLLAVALAVYLCSRQLRWQPVDPSRMWRLPIVLAVLGALSIGGAAAKASTADVVLLALSGLLAVASGLAMGRVARFRPLTAAPSEGSAPTVESRTGWVGVALWGGLLVVRILLEVVGHRMGATVATSSGVILLVIALNRAARILVLSARLAPRRASMVRS